MKRWILALFLLQLSAAALGKEYGHYDVAKVISAVGASAADPQGAANVADLNQILDDLNGHAGSWPPRFDSADDLSRAKSDVTELSSALDSLSDKFSHNPPMLLRLALLNSLGYNLDIAGTGERAEALFSKLLELTPNDPRTNFDFGVFYALTATKRANAIPYLEKAKAQGFPNADYWLGITYLALGENTKEKAIENLTSYNKRAPGDLFVANFLSALRLGKVEYKQGLPSAPVSKP